MAKSKICEGRREIIDRSVELITKREVGERLREVLEMLIKHEPKGENPKSAGEVVDRLIEEVSKREMSEDGGIGGNGGA